MFPPRGAEWIGRRPPRRRGVSLLELLVVVAILAILIALVLVAVQRTRASAARLRCANNLRQLAVGLHGYHTARGVLPPGHTSETKSDPYKNLAWHARILAHVEQQPLWTRAEEAYRSAPSGSIAQPPHGPILATVVPVFICPADPRTRQTQIAYGSLPVALTSFQGNAGLYYAWRDGTLYADSAVKFADITDGTSQTLLIGERPASADHEFGWWYRGIGQQGDGSADMILGVRERNATGSRYPCPIGPYHFVPGKLENQCDMFHFWSPHPGGAHFAFADGSVRFLTYSADPILPALASRAGGEAVPEFE